MNSPHTPSQPTDDLTELQAQYDSLRQLVNTILILLVIVSGTLTIFLFRQYKVAHREVLAVRTQYQDAVARYQQIKPKMDDFEKRIRDFAHAHPDFAGILANRGINLGQAPAVPPKK